MVYINPNVYIAVAILLLLIPLDWLTAAAVAAAFHEICHMGIIYVTGGTIESINIGIGGTEIVALLNGKRKELLAILSGPAGSFLLMGLCNIFPKLSICACVQGLFNLLPILPLDGGRSMQCIFSYYWPDKIDFLQNLMVIISAAVFVAMAIIGAFALKLGFWPIAGCVLLLLKVVLRKIPCKER